MMITRKYFSPPVFSLAFRPYWRRNFMMWKKLAVPSILGSLIEPLFYLLALGFGLGSMLPSMEGIPYSTFVAGGIVCTVILNSATAEVLHPCLTRMQTQKIWEAVMNTPLTLDDIVLGELLWAATKSTLSGVAMLAVIWLFGLFHEWTALWIIPMSFVIGLCFAGMGLAMTGFAARYDFFMFYFTLVITPMTLLGAVFFPISRLPVFLQMFSSVLPLTHAIQLVRPVLHGQAPDHIWLHIAVLLAYGLIGFYVALAFMRRRLLK